MHLSPSQALLGLVATLVPSALGAPANITTPTLVERSAIPAPSNLACYNKMEGCKYKDVYMEKAREYGVSMCNKQKGVWAAPGWPGEVEWLRNPFWVSYNMKVEWKEGCTAPGDGTVDVFNPGPGVDCFDVLWMTWANCKGNGGRGGSIDFGCLTYHYNVINGNEIGHGYCVDIPFGNSTGY